MYRRGRERESELRRRSWFCWNTRDRLINRRRGVIFFSDGVYLKGLSKRVKMVSFNSDFCGVLE